jgi:hypothetical protein
MITPPGLAMRSIIQYTHRALEKNTNYIDSYRWSTNELKRLRRLAIYLLRDA